MILQSDSVEFSWFEIADYSRPIYRPFEASFHLSLKQSDLNLLNEQLPGDKIKIAF